MFVKRASCITFFSVFVILNLLVEVSSNNESVTNPPIPPVCNKSRFTICWRSNPPYIFRDKNTTKVTGILPEILQDMLNRCKCPNNELIFTHQVQSEKGLQNCTTMDDVSFVMPFRPYREGDTRERRYLTFVESPGIVLVVNRNALTDQAKSKVLKEVLQVWTVAVLIIMLAAIFGIVVWFLDMRKNPEEFPRSVYPGLFDGLWWAFVTLTTVGYGDKAPKFLLARLFSVVWMFVGLVMVSLLTATMTTALTSGRIENYDNIVGNTIGVLEDSAASQEAFRKGANRKKYSDLDSLYNALEGSKVDGVMVDTYMASYAQYHFNMAGLFKANSFGFLYKHGVLVGGEQMSGLLPECIAGQIDSKPRFADDIIDKYVRGSNLITEEERKGKDFQTDFNIFEKDSAIFQDGLRIFGATLAFLVVLAIVWEIIYRKRKRRSKNLTKYEDGELAMASHNKRLSPAEIHEMMARLEDLEKILGDLSEFRTIYRRLRGDIMAQNEHEVQGAQSGLKNGAFVA
ncbi:predicted protein [Nematostella vectensis]|uniref:Potassium channel domain-containing protein n=1 Tax=Nematostella vectensis TaxID=45351 RepID=A7RRN5_NEMVE|nr:uncharacterized protein LOC5517927 [Nematostella vectensis]EDO45791.1 predicted protein [Nematostella vectensis]|eukprot:XP_001637854.1 predicted protein [Nematostella vectensis]